MDESSDFQEKKNLAVLKTTQKPKLTTKPKPKKAPERIRGQKDIRSALKSKKNELVAYSNDFDKICKKSGIDVDSEQLQLAIALSKSLQRSESNEESPSSGSNSQERTAKIRTTLLEYGFVVPEIKITATKSRKLKRYRKNYKLLQSTEEEKQQVISDRYSQVLFNSLDTRSTENIESSSSSSVELYHIATNIAYDCIKDNNIFYVEDILQKTPNSVGCLLKDWSKIPGRPSSPVYKTIKFDFADLSCSQEELDSILSGPVCNTQEIFKSKYDLLSKIEQIDKTIVSKNIKDNTEMDTDLDKSVEVKMYKSCTDQIGRVEPSTNNKNVVEIIDIEEPNSLTVTQSIRSYSPDIFDDEVSSIMDDSKHNTQIPFQDLPCKNITKVCDEVMDLTECVIVNSQNNLNIKPNSQLSQGSNITKRRSNDFMEITECLAGSSQPVRENIILEENIDLTQNSDKESDVSIIAEDKKNYEQVIKSMDLTQSSDSNEELPFVQISGKNSMDDTVILNEEVYAGLRSENRHTSPFMNDIVAKLHKSNIVDKLQRKSNSENSEYNSELPKTISIDSENENEDLELNIINPENRINSPINNINVLSGETTEKVGLPKAISVESDDEEESVTKLSEKRAISPIEHIAPNNFNLSIEPINEGLVERVDLIGGKSKSSLMPEVAKSKTESFFEEFIHYHSEGSSKEHTNDQDVLKIEESCNNSAAYETSPNKSAIDITEDSDSEKSIDIIDDKTDRHKHLFDTSNLGKIGSVSIDYDDMFDDMMKSHTSSESQVKSTPSKSNTTDFNTDQSNKPSYTNSDVVSNSSQNSELFEISDKELDYSLHKSKLDIDNPKENFDFGGISVMDNIPDLPSWRQSTNSVGNRSFNRSKSESFMPVVNLNITNQDPITSSSCVTSPCKITKDIVAKTPKNGEYIIKTDQVTPMMNYEAMSTPERNNELDKYGLKPFKRKRAIQLLTHLYNQTHPIVESCSNEDLPSPSKKRKQNTQSTKTSPTKIPSSFKSQKTIVPSRSSENTDEVIEGIDKENDIYDVTNELPDVRDIACLEEDWVFQKRERAKIHSCRVPLHIAFHNYVSTRFRLREAILRYEPVNIDVIHKGLVANGYRYDPKDLLKFMDRKCITVKTVDNNVKNNKKHF